jgi:hypothetical protein
MLFQMLKDYRYMNGEIDNRLTDLEQTYSVKYKRNNKSLSQADGEEEKEQGGEFFDL